MLKFPFALPFQILMAVQLDEEKQANKTAVDAIRGRSLFIDGRKIRSFVFDARFKRVTIGQSDEFAGKCSGHGQMWVREEILRLEKCYDPTIIALSNWCRCGKRAAIFAG